MIYKDGSTRDVIKQGNVGTMFVEGTPSDKYLYDKIAFDSRLEKANIMTDIGFFSYPIGQYEGKTDY